MTTLKLMNVKIFLLMTTIIKLLLMEQQLIMKEKPIYHKIVLLLINLIKSFFKKWMNKWLDAPEKTHFQKKPIFLKPLLNKEAILLFIKIKSTLLLIPLKDYLMATLLLLPITQETLLKETPFFILLQFSNF
jgi:hypothetical protein